MKSTGLLVAVGLLLVAGAGVWWSNKSEAEKGSKPAEGAAPKILSLVESDIVRVEWKRAAGESTVVEKDAAGAWKISAPVAYAADREAVLGLLTAVSAITSEKLVDEKPADVAGFGLTRPGTQIVVKLKDGKTRTLSIGDDAPVGGGAYAQVDGDVRVFTLASFTRGNLDKKAADLRDRRLLTFDAEKLSRIELNAKGAAIEFARSAPGEWAIARPRPVRADNWQVEELLRQLKEAKLDATLDAEQQKDLARQFAASAPLATVSVSDPAGTQKLELRRNKENKLYAHSSAVEGFHLLPDEAAKAVDKSLDDFRNHKLFDFGFSDPTKIEYKDSARQISLSKAGDRWLAAAKPMDAVGVQGLIDRLRELAAAKFADSGFTTPAIELSVVSKDGKLTEKVAVSKAGERYIARREGDASLYELDAKSVEALQKAAQIKEEPAKSGAKK